MRRKAKKKIRRNKRISGTRENKYAYKIPAVTTRCPLISQPLRSTQKSLTMTNTMEPQIMRYVRDGQAVHPHSNIQTAGNLGAHKESITVQGAWTAAASLN